MKFSIVTPSFNSAAYIEATLRSIADQGYPDVENIVMDGGSRDGTVDILRRFPGVTWTSEKDAGQSDALNKGFRRCTGDILAWQNADDLYLPGAFAAVAECFRSHPEVDVVYGDYQLVRGDGSWLCDVRAVEWNPWLFSHGRFVPMQPTAFWRRRVYEQIGDLDVGLHYCMDVDFFAKAAKRFKFRRIPAMLGQFRVHEGSKTQNRANDRKVKAEHHKVLSAHFGYGPVDSAIFHLFRVRSRLAQTVKSKWIRRA
jgi:glycosyltransferase involved in cell wall biosynthesis